MIQSAKDLCRETLVINGQEFSDHCNSDVSMGSSILKQKLLLDVFEQGVSSPKHYSHSHHAHDAEGFHLHKRECVDRIIKAACRTISGGDSYDEILSLFQSTHFLITP